MGATVASGGIRSCAPFCCGGWAAGAAALAPSGTPLPRRVHATLPAPRRPDGRLLFVGDVHGCAQELRALLDVVGFSQGVDTLVLVGDLVNKGPASGEVVRLARQLGAWAVRGNHDDELLEAWYRVGRYAAGLGSYRHDALQQVGAEDILWLRELPLSLSVPRLSALVVHAGLVPGVPLERQRFRDLLWMRDLAREGQGWRGLEKPRPGDADGAAGGGSVPWAGAWEGPEHVVFGHDASRSLQLHAAATGLDTGCCYGGALTGLLVPAAGWAARRLVAVPAAREYCKPTGEQRPLPQSHLNAPAWFAPEAP